MKTVTRFQLVDEGAFGIRCEKVTYPENEKLVYCQHCGHGQSVTPGGQHGKCEKCGKDMK